jgi:hypothetical protein
LGTAEENPGKKISSSQVHSCPALSGSFLAAPYTAAKGEEGKFV